MAAQRSIFERIMAREIPADIVHEDADCVAFRDVSPQAPTHVLLVPRKAIPALDQLSAEDEGLLGRMMLVVPKLAAQLELSGGYRVVVNCGPDGGQSVDHLHIHILGGRPMKWPPG